MFYELAYRQVNFYDPSFLTEIEKIYREDPHLYHKLISEDIVIDNYIVSYSASYFVRGSMNTNYWRKFIAETIDPYVKIIHGSHDVAFMGLDSIFYYPKGDFLFIDCRKYKRMVEMFIYLQEYNETLTLEYYDSCGLMSIKVNE